MKILVICIGGASASSRHKSETLSACIRNVLDAYPDHVEYEFCAFSPWFFRRKIRKILSVIDKTKYRDGILFIAKSLGAYRLLNRFLSYWGPSYTFKRYAIVTIDPYAPFKRTELVAPPVSSA